MINLNPGDMIRVTFSFPGTPSALPTANVYAGDVLLGFAAVTQIAGNNRYKATRALPATGMTDDTIIQVLATADVDGTTHDVDMIAGVMNYYRHVSNDVERVGGMLDGIRSVFAGITRMSSWLRALIRSDAADAVAMSEINLGGGTYDPASHSLEASSDTESLANAVAVQLGSVSITRLGPDFDPDTKFIKLTQGDDYQYAKDRAIDFALDLPGIDLEGATARFRATAEYLDPIEGTATVVDVDSSPKLRLEWTRAQTSVAPGCRKWDAEIIDADGEVETVVSGDFELVESRTTLGE